MLHCIDLRSSAHAGFLHHLSDHQGTARLLPSAPGSTLLIPNFSIVTSTTDIADGCRSAPSPQTRKPFFMTVCGGSLLCGPGTLVSWQGTDWLWLCVPCRQPS